MSMSRNPYRRSNTGAIGSRPTILPTFSFEDRSNSSPILTLGAINRRKNGLVGPSESLETLVEQPSRDVERSSTYSDTFSENEDEDELKGKNHKVSTIVTWDGPDDPENPLNWSAGRKWVATILVSLFTFISPFSSTMVTPALNEIGTTYNIPEGFSRQLVVSIFLLGFAVGPFTLAPLSEVYGRVRPLQYANLVYLVFNTVCPFATTKEQFLAFRFISGMGASAPQALCNGVLADAWRKEERGKGQAIYGILTFISPTLAPIVGAFIVKKLFWGWIFWIVSMFTVLVQVAAIFFLRETFPPKILGDKAKKLRKATGNPDYRTEYDTPDKSRAAILRRRLVLPFIMLFAHPAVQVPSLFRAVLYGIMYLVLSTFQQVWIGTYMEDPITASLNYLSLAIGFIIGLQISHPLMDRSYAYYQARNNHIPDGLPEWRIPPMLLGGILAPAGLVLYGWSAQYKLHWAVPDAGCLILAIGLIIAFQAAQAYVTDAYDHRYAASAAAVGAFMRTMAGFGFPLFAPAMYGALQVGLGNTLLAGVTLVLATLGPALMWFYGAKMRAWSTAGLD